MRDIRSSSKLQKIVTFYRTVRSQPAEGKSMSFQYSVLILTGAIAFALVSINAIATETDEKIESAAKASHVFITYLVDDDVTINSDNGLVTLSGTVVNASHRSLAQDTITNLAGVVGVDNQLEIIEAAPHQGSDAWLRTKIKATLLYHRAVSALTEVSVTDGIVTLRGNADNEAEKELTAEYVMDIAGVVKVNNEMTVAASFDPSEAAGQLSNTREKSSLSETIDDASITAMAKMVLLSHRSTSALRTNVVTNAGVVTLSGKAKNEAEIRLATKLVSDSRGVLYVKNVMTVAKI